MDTTIENAPSIIEAAAQSTLGILALLILTVGVIAYLFFQKSSDRVKVVIFSMIFIGMAGFGLVILSEASPAAPGPVAQAEGRPDRAAQSGEGESVQEPSEGDVPLVDPIPVESEEPPSEPARTEISLAYLGDLYNCSLQLQIAIGDRTFVPQGNVFQATGVLEGRQPYEVSGWIQCPYVGQCEAAGDGTLAVVPNASYNVVWQNNEVGVCNVVLQRGS